MSTARSASQNNSHSNETNPIRSRLQKRINRNQKQLAQNAVTTETYILNNSSLPHVSQNVLQIPAADITYSISGQHKTLQIVFCLLLLAFLIKLAHKHLSRERRPNFFKLISDCIVATTINPDIASLASEQNESLISKWSH